MHLEKKSGNIFNIRRAERNTILKVTPLRPTQFTAWNPVQICLRKERLNQT